MAKRPRSYDDYARKMAKKWGVPVGVLLSLGSAESGRSHFNADGSVKTNSNSGAIGWGQLMPGTAKELGVDPFDPKQNIEGAARYLRQQIDRFGSLKLGIAAYNAGPGNVESGKWEGFAETRQYVADVLGGAGNLSGVETEGGRAKGSMIVDEATLVKDRSGLTSAVLASNEALASGDYDPVRASSDLAATLAQFSEVPEQQVAEPTVATAAPAKGGEWQKWVDTSDKRRGPSAPHGQEILSFVGQIGRMAGTRLKVWGNESHSLTTVNGKRSAHADGNAADIPASGLELRRLGRAALIAAGADPKWAAKQKGGLFNIGGYQIIFATDEGGNHHDHVHVGLRG